METFDERRLDEIAMLCKLYINTYKDGTRKGRTLQLIEELHEATDKYAERDVPETLGIRVRDRTKTRARVR